MAKHTARIRSRKHAAPVLGTSLFALSTLSLSLHAQTTETPAATEAVQEVKIQASRIEPFKVEQSASSKITQPLVDTPKTIQVINQQVIKEQGAATLMDALRNTPGITMQLGENGNTSAGDTFQMRGFSTQTSTFLDGVRDLGAVSRDVFNLEQVEVVKGPAGADIGRGAASGYINLISKLPTQDDISDLSVTVGTADKKRVTADIGRALGDNAAFRVNVMAQDSGVDGRDEVGQKGWALAPSMAFGLGTPTRVYLYSQHLRHNNRPDGGIPSIGFDGYYRAPTTAGNATSEAKAAALNAAPRVDRSNYYGSVNDREKVTADMFTAKIEHDLGAGTTVRNISRYGKTRMDRVLTGVSGSISDSNVVNVNDPSTWTLGRSRQRVDQTNEVLTNQTSVNTSFQTGGLTHDVAAGVEFIYERQLTKGTGTSAQTINGITYAAVTAPAASLYRPQATDAMGVPYLTGVDTEGKTVTAALYALDTITFNPAWKLNLGVRFDRYNTNTTSGTIVTSSNASNYPGYAVGSVVPSDLDDADLLTSWNTGLVYKPASNGTVYAAYANSMTPPGSANFGLSSGDTNANNPSFDPQTTESFELGTKWELLDKRLNLTAAVYQTENDKQVSYDDVSDTYTQFGKTRVRGIELGLVGQITNFWQVSAGVAKTKTTQKDQYRYSSTNGITESNGVRWSPEWTATVWTSYTHDAWTVGGGLRHVSEQKRVITAGGVAATTNMPDIPSYTVADLMLGYKVSKNVNLQLNVYNLFDKDYISTLNNGGGRLVLGAPRSAALTASIKF